MYDAMSKLLKRLKPVLKIIEKKVGANNEQLKDLTTFVLSMIGDEKQRDYNTTLNIKWQNV